jgi:hypothetical protein
VQPVRSHSSGSHKWDWEKCRGNLHWMSPLLYKGCPAEIRRGEHAGTELFGQSASIDAMGPLVTPVGPQLAPDDRERLDGSPAPQCSRARGAVPGGAGSFVQPGAAHARPFRSQERMWRLAEFTTGRPIDMYPTATPAPLNPVRTTKRKRMDPAKSAFGRPARATRGDAGARSRTTRRLLDGLRTPAPRRSAAHSASAAPRHRD